MHSEMTWQQHYQREVQHNNRLLVIHRTTVSTFTMADHVFILTPFFSSRVHMYKSPGIGRKFIYCKYVIFIDSICKNVGGINRNYERSKPFFLSVLYQKSFKMKICILLFIYLNVDLCLQNLKIHIRVNPAKPFLTQILKLRFYLNLEHLFCLLNVLYIIQVNAFLYNDALCCLCLKYKNQNLLTFQILKRTESYFQIQL